MSKLVHIVPILLVGGTGSRLSPLSTKWEPKQFIQLQGNNSLFQQTCLRIKHAGLNNPIIIGSNQHRFLIEQQLEQVQCVAEKILLEPESRNTCASIASALHWAAKFLDNANSLSVMVLPSDHHFKNSQFQHFIKENRDEINNCSIGLVAIKPRFASTQYGYLELKEDCKNQKLKIERFIEKPETAVAQELFRNGFFWNAGLVLGKLDKLLKVIEKHAPDIYFKTLNSVHRGRSDLGFYRFETTSFVQVANISFDYAVLEKLIGITAMVYDGEWNDLGQWQDFSKSWLQIGTNRYLGKVRLNNSNDNIIYSSSKPISLNNVSNMLVVERDDEIVIQPREPENLDGSERIGELKASFIGGSLNDGLSIENGSSLSSEIEKPKVGVRYYRPWGWFRFLSIHEMSVVKQIWIKPNGILSLQHHLHRKELWTVLEGTVEAVIETNRYVLEVGDSAKVEVGQKHRLINEFDQPCLILEVQSGSKICETDIVRHHDVYQRGFDK